MNFEHLVHNVQLLSMTRSKLLKILGWRTGTEELREGYGENCLHGTEIAVMTGVVFRREAVRLVLKSLWNRVWWKMLLSLGASGVEYLRNWTTVPAP